jgi:hypothetical protein
MIVSMHFESAIPLQFVHIVIHHSRVGRFEEVFLISMLANSICVPIERKQRLTGTL